MRKKLKAEMARVETLLARIRPSISTEKSRVEAELYGARQALAWALGDNAMSPSKMGDLGLTKRKR